MKRKAILITTSSETEPMNTGDSKTLCIFLRSQFGGKWEDDEISSLENPTKKEIVEAVRSARQSEYAFVMFSGRGKKASGNLPWPEFEFPLSTNETITERELNPGSPRCTLFLTCTGTSSQLQSLKLPSEDSKNVATSKTSFNGALTVAESGLVKVNVSTKDAFGSKTPSFTRYLIGETIGWLTKNKGILSIGDATNLAKAGLLRDGFQINAEYLPGRRRRDFPFAVNI